MVATVPWSTSAELCPTDAEPVPEPVVLKYAKAAPATASIAMAPATMIFGLTNLRI